MACFYSSVSKTWGEKIVFYVVKGKKRLVCVVSYAQKTNVTFLCRSVIKYPQTFFQRLSTIGFIIIHRSISYDETEASPFLVAWAARCGRDKKTNNRYLE